MRLQEGVLLDKMKKEENRGMEPIRGGWLCVLGGPRKRPMRKGSGRAGRMP